LAHGFLGKPQDIHDEVFFDFPFMNVRSSATEDKKGNVEELSTGYRWRNAGTKRRNGKRFWEELGLGVCFFSPAWYMWEEIAFQFGMPLPLFNQKVSADRYLGVFLCCVVEVLAGLG
jgi:hypothetical protein